jgi:hypothetical protein
MPKPTKLHTCFRFALLASVLSIALVAHAGSNVNVTLTGVGGAQYGYGGNYANGEYVMPYYVTIDNAAPIAVICDDFNHQNDVGNHWTAAIHTFNDLAGTRFGASNSTQYHEAAWLASQMTSSSPLSTISAIQFAIWKLFSNNTPVVSGELSWLSAAATAAANNYYGMDFSTWRILTPVSPASPQEFFYQVPAIPEPGVLLELMVGLLAFAGMYLAKRSRVATARI